ncbi:MAG TPA: 16S rRNA (guanine(527)-N(7))-methyltransferase RsmG [Candidatus Limnocylindria bacterium]|nr:16S rRNA (guanine(527)-N(7))-methyltransferase RsmG [Candidatus Limnocylindria bacterium]HXH53853.1 16S rRNA (guanine(527)-N(7))-methyltransferase RsmG [Sphingomicrobium sp.]
MIEDVAAAARRRVSRETFDRLELYAELLRAEAQRQNLVSRSTLGQLWQRHILDSAQLVRFELRPGVPWADIGSGAGLPGIVVALLVEGPVTLIEPRRLRADFLARAVDALGLSERVRVEAAKVEQVRGSYDMLTARAVAALDRLLDLSHHLSTRNSIWVLPKGRSAQSELAQARRSWQCEARSEPSYTDPQSQILVLTGVRARQR